MSARRAGFCTPVTSLILLLAAGAQAFAAETQAPLTARERSIAVESFAAERLALWQTRLHLDEWKISVLVARATELRPRTLGNIHWDLDKKSAVIRVLDPEDYKLPFNDMLKDVEFTVVHELIHLGIAPVLSNLQRNDANRRDEEYAVNHMATALLNLERSK